MLKEKLRGIRKIKGYSQKEVAEAIHTTSSNYSRKENGEVKILNEEWEKIAKFLDVPFDDIYEDDSKTIIYNQNHATGEHSGLYNNCNYNIPNSIVQNLQDYISFLKKENEILGNENQSLKQGLNKI